MKSIAIFTYCKDQITKKMLLLSLSVNRLYCSLNLQIAVAEKYSPKPGMGNFSPGEPLSYSLAPTLIKTHLSVAF